MHAAKVWNLALFALVECALVHGEILKLSKVDVAFGHDSTLLVVALLDGRLQAEALDCLLVVGLFIELLAQERHVVIEFDLLLAARAVEVAEGDLGRSPSVRKHHVEAFSMEDMSASGANARLFAQLACEANATELALSAAHQNVAGFARFDGTLDALFVKAGKVL